MKWGEIYRTKDKVSERGHKPGFYVVATLSTHKQDELRQALAYALQLKA